MTGNDKIIQLPADLWEACALLTRLPLPDHAARGAQAAWAYPLAGVVIGVVAMALGWIALLLGLPTPLIAVIVALTPTVITGGLHEDGLADCADGFWGGTTAERRLEIMKDSRIGSYGVIALVFALLARWIAVDALLSAGAGLWWLLGVGALSRVPMVWQMGLMPNARGNGLSQSVGQPSMAAMQGAALTGAFAGMLFLGWAVFPAMIWGLVAALGVALIARAKIGGQTGDVLGTTQQMTELAVLMALVVWWA